MHRSEVIHILVDQKYMHQLPESSQRKLPHHSSILSHILSSYYDNRYVSTCLRLVYEASDMVLDSFGMFSMRRYASTTSGCVDAGIGEREY